MAQQLPCDLCQDEPAVLMQTSLADGTVLTVGVACLPQFFGGALLGVIDAGEHKSIPTKCQACRRIHERMTTPVAPIGDVSRETPLEIENTDGTVSVVGDE
jgi:hypothetical protein